MRSVAFGPQREGNVFLRGLRGLVVARRTVGELKSLEDLLGPGSKRARATIEACREAWHVHDVLTQWPRRPARRHDEDQTDRTPVPWTQDGPH
jgi:hypothetical protein